MNNGSNNGVGFLGLLTILFIGLKLCHVINWSWLLVFLPLYGGLFVVGLVLLGVWLVTMLSRR